MRRHLQKHWQPIVGLLLGALFVCTLEYLRAEPDHRQSLWHAEYQLPLNQQGIKDTLWRVKVGMERQANRVDFDQPCELIVILKTG
ncbi:MAG: hypothetical protein AB7I37_26220 [Pirellulales bacterium]